MSSADQYKRKSQELQLFLGDLGDQLARVTGFVQRKSDMTGSKRVQILGLGSLEHGKTSLRGFCRVAQAPGGCILALVLHQRLYGCAVALLHQVSQTRMSFESQ